MTANRWPWAGLCLVTMCFGGSAFAQPPQGAAATPPARAGKVDVITVHDRSLEGNLSGDSADRGVSVYLPPSYSTDRNRRYPVLYLLHGFTDSDEPWFGRIPHFVNVPQAADTAVAAGTREMIYPGDHVSGVAARLVSHVFPFFSSNLSFGAARR